MKNNSTILRKTRRDAETDGNHSNHRAEGVMVNEAAEKSSHKNHYQPVRVSPTIETPRVPKSGNNHKIGATAPRNRNQTN